MPESTAVWYVPGPDNQPRGPLTAEQVVAELRSGKLTAATLGWKEGMAEWLPLGQIAPFAKTPSAGDPAAAPAMRTSAKPTTSPAASAAPPAAPAVSTTAARSSGWGWRLVVGLVLLLVLGGGGAVGYHFVSEWLAISHAEAAINQREFEDASRKLQPIADRSFHSDNVDYLLSIIDIREYAAADDQEGSERALRRPERRLKSLFEQNDSLRQRASEQLADAIADVPADAPDAISRSLTLAELLEQLKILDRPRLAELLLAKVREHAAEADPKDLLELPVDQLVQWDERLIDPLVERLLPDENLQPHLIMMQMTGLHRWAREEKAVAGRVAKALVDRAKQCEASGKTQQVEALLRGAVEIDPEQRPAVARQRFKRAQAQLRQGELGAILPAVGQAVRDCPELSSEAAQLCLDLARTAGAADPRTVGQALQEAKRLDPKLAESQEVVLLSIDTAPAGSAEKLQRCQEYLSRYPDGEQRTRVMTTLLADTVALAKAAGRYGQHQVAPFLGTARQVAEELIAKHPETPELDLHLVSLTNILAANTRDQEQVGQAIDLAEKLLEAKPETDQKVELAQSIARWRETVGQYHDKEFDELVQLVEDKLKIMTISTPGEVRVLASAPRSVHVVRVTVECSASKFSSEEADIFRNWVAGGGIFWAENDVIGLLDIQQSDNFGYGRRVCDRAVSAQMCPIVTDVAKAVVSTMGSHHDPINLMHKNAIPLLSDGRDTVWSLVPYGKGWVSNVKTVDPAQYDGARFWLNFRLFCIGHAIPGAPKPDTSIAGSVVQPPPSPDSASATPVIPKATPAPAEEPTTVTTKEELAKAFEKLDEQKVMWVQLARSDLSDEQLEQLTTWIEGGGVLWLDGDLAKAFDFPLWQVSADKVPPSARIAKVTHPILADLTPERDILFTLAPSRYVVAGAWDELNKDMTPLLGWPVSKTRVFLSAAIRPRGKGAVVFRPRELATGNEDSRQFDESLQQYSFGLQ